MWPHSPNASMAVVRCVIRQIWTSMRSIASVPFNGLYTIGAITLFSRGMDTLRVSKSDREWFDRHPGVDE